MFETFNVLLKISIFRPLLFICICLITLVATINLCAKKRDSGKLASNKSINVQSIKAVGSSKKSVSPCSPSGKEMAGKSLKKSPDGTSKKKSPDKNGNIISAEKNEKAKPSPEKVSKEEKKNVDGGDGGGDEKGKGKDESGEDSFPLHKPIVRDVDRAEEIKNLGYVDRKRDDYKTIRNDLPESDFDKSLGLPAINDDKKK